MFEIRSVAAMEWNLRIRRSSTWVLFVLLCGVAFLLMPDVRSGGVEFLIRGRRVLLNSAATSLTSALLGGFVLSLFGFYILSDSVHRDLRSGVGRLLGATPLSSFSYLTGKFLGNTLFLYMICFIFMAACMGVHAIRGEAALEPLVFAATYGVTFIPMAPFIAAFALLFECVPFLSGRAGDFLYFFLWVLLLTLPAVLVGSSRFPHWLFGLDITGTAFFISEIARVSGSTSFTIGYAPYDATLPPLLFPGLLWEPGLIVPRCLAALASIPLLGIALAAFRRFDPAAGSEKTGSGGFTSRMQRFFSSGKLHLLIPRGAWITGTPGLVRTAALDAQFTFALSPLLAVLIAGWFAWSILAPLNALRAFVLPFLFYLLVPVLAGISTRDRIENSTQLLFSAPLVQRYYVLLKFLSALGVALLFAAVPLVRLLLDSPFAGAAMLVGIVLSASAATSFGVLTGTPKTYTVIFLLFLYLAGSSGNEPAFDFAGLHLLATPAIAVSYAAAALLLLAAAWIRERWRNAAESGRG